MNTPTAKPYKAWDLPTRLFHWINFLCVITLSFLGLVMLKHHAKIIEFCTLLEIQQPDAIAVCETWLKDYVALNSQMMTYTRPTALIGRSLELEVSS